MPVSRCQARSVDQASTSPLNSPAGATRASTSRGVGQRPSNQARAATRTVAESTAGRSKCPISSTRNPAVAGPTPASPCSSAHVRSPSPVVQAASISARVPSIADRAAAKAFYASDTYSHARTLRENAGVMRMVVVDGT